MEKLIENVHKCEGNGQNCVVSAESCSNMYVKLKNLIEKHKNLSNIAYIIFNQFQSQNFRIRLPVYNIISKFFQSDLNMRSYVCQYPFEASTRRTDNIDEGFDELSKRCEFEVVTYDQDWRNKLTLPEELLAHIYRNHEDAAEKFHEKYALMVQQGGRREHVDFESDTRFALVSIRL